MKSFEEMLPVLEEIASGYDDSAVQRQVLRAATLSLLYLKKEGRWDELEDLVTRLGGDLSEEEKATLRQYGIEPG